jgi:hypothetical protein
VFKLCDDDKIVIRYSIIMYKKFHDGNFQIHKISILKIYSAKFGVN